MINIKLTDILETGTQYTKKAIAIESLFIFIIFQIIPFNFNNIPVLFVLLDKIIYFNSILSDSNIVSINLINSIVDNYFFSFCCPATTLIIYNCFYYIFISHRFSNAGGWHRQVDWSDLTI